MAHVIIEVWPHPSLAAAAFVTELPVPLAELDQHPKLPSLRAFLAPAAQAPIQASDAVRSAVRDLLRAGGYKPSGRAKPASEYLVRAAAEGGLNPINPLVDACNVTSLHSGLPISVVDLERAEAPLALGVVRSPRSYVFNASGQEIELQGLLCLHDALGPCANAVKDAQRTKTTDRTRRTLSILWGSQHTREQTERACAWYRELLHTLGARTEDVELRPGAEPIAKG